MNNADNNIIYIHLNSNKMLAALLKQIENNNSFFFLFDANSKV
jgi:hypothetical protein